jgi:hypothetical protein
MASIQATELTPAGRRQLCRHNSEITKSTGVTDGFTFVSTVPIRVTAVGVYVTEQLATNAATVQLGYPSSAGAVASVSLSDTQAVGAVYAGSISTSIIPAGTVLVWDQSLIAGNGKFVPFFEFEVIESGET